MQRTRREALGLVGGIATALLGGCLGEGNGGGDGAAESPTLPSPSPAGDTETPTATPTETDTETDEPTETETDEGTPTETPGGLPDGLNRVDTPPYEVEAIKCNVDDSGESNRDPLYLCANMPAEPSLSFEQASTRGTLFADEGLQMAADNAGTQLYATLLTKQGHVDRLTDGGDAYSLAADTDFETHAVLIVQTGWGSSAIVPHLKRIEETETGIHAFGCYTQPCVYTEDFTARSAVVRFERPETLESGVVSLTVDPETRYNVATGEGVVTIEQSE